MTRSRAIALLATAAASAAIAAACMTSGCGGSYRPDGASSGADASADTAPDGSSEPGPVGNECGADLQTDAKNCGRCGHDCLGGACKAGKCGAWELAAVSAPLAHALVSGKYVYVSTVAQNADQLGGIWRVPTAGGTPEAVVAMHAAEAMAVLGDQLYFVVDEAPADGGGLYSCPLAGPAPCAPTLIAAADTPRSVTVDRGRVFYTDAATGKGLMIYAPPAPPVPFRRDEAEIINTARNVYVDGDAVFFTSLAFVIPQRAGLHEVFADGGVVDLYLYVTMNANDGRLFGAPSSLLFAAFDFRNTTGGIVRRVARTGGVPCDLGGGGNKRPYGIYADTTHVYWANQGEGEPPAYVNGTVVSCEQAGCCATPQVLWTGNHPLAVTGDADAVYFTTRPSGSIWKIAKP